jgi:hypothetical protein
MRTTQQVMFFETRDHADENVDKHAKYDGQGKVLDP